MPPFPVGASPFRIKGVAFRGHFTHYEQAVPGGSAAVLSAVEDPDLRAYAGQQFLDASVYDVFVLPALDRVAAGLVGADEAAFIREGARHQAESDLRGVYRILLRVVSPARLMDRVARVANRYFDFAPTEMLRDGTNGAELVREGFPLVLFPWYAAVSEGYLTVAVQRTGAAQVRVEPGHAGVTGQSHGVDVTTVRIRVTWG